MFNVLCILFIGAMAGIVPTLVIGEWLYHNRLSALEDHWTKIFKNSQSEWTEFYTSEVKRLQNEAGKLIDQAAEDAAKATDDLWRGRKIVRPKKEEPKN